MSAENARVKVVVRLRPPADPSTNASDTIKVFPEQPGLLNIRWLWRSICAIGRISSLTNKCGRSKSSDDADPTQREFLFDGAEGTDATQSVRTLFGPHPFAAFAHRRRVPSCRRCSTATVNHRRASFRTCACLCRPLRPPLPTTAQVDHVLEGYNACIFAYGQARAAPTQPAPIARPRTQDTLPSLLIPETHRRAPRRRRGGLRHDPRPLRTYHGRRGAVTVSAAVVTCNPHRRRHRIGRTIRTRRF